MAFAKDSYWLKSGFYTVLLKSSIMLLGFGGFFFLVRITDKPTFGVWALFLTVTSLIETARNGLIQNAQIKFLTTEPKENHPEIISASFTLNILLTFVSIIILLILGPLLSSRMNAPALQTMLYFYIFTTITLIPYSQFNFIQQGNMDFKGIFFSNVAKNGILFLFIFICFIFKLEVDLLNLVHIQTIGAIVGASVSYFFVRKYFVFAMKVNFQRVLQLFNYGKYVFGTNLSSMLFKSIDQFMIGSMISTASVAVYNTAIRITNLVEIPTLSVAAIVFPKSAQRMATEGISSVKYLYEKSVGVILAVLFPALLFILIFPSFIIRIVAGEAYLDTVPILQVTILYCFFVPFANQFGTILDSIGMPKVNFYVNLFGAVVNVVSNLFFINKFGLIGASYGTLTAYFINFFIVQYILAKKLNVNTLNTFKYARQFYVQGYEVAMNYFLKKKRIKSNG